MRPFVNLYILCFILRLRLLNQILTLPAWLCHPAIAHAQGRIKHYFNVYSIQVLLIYFWYITASLILSYNFILPLKTSNRRWPEIVCFGVGVLSPSYQTCIQRQLAGFMAHNVTHWRRQGILWRPAHHRCLFEKRLLKLITKSGITNVLP